MKIVRIPALLLILLGLVASPASAFHGGSISGRVTNAAGDPLEDICIYAETFWAGYYAQTDASGSYKIEDLEPGEYRVFFQDCGYPAVHLSEWYDDKPDYDSATPVLVLPAVERKGVDAELARGASISGTLLDVNGAPAATCATAYDEDFDDYDSYPRSTFTDEHGRYTIGGLAGGSYRVQFGPCVVFAVYADGEVPAPGAPSPRPTGHIPSTPGGGYGYVAEWYNDKPDFDSADPVEVAAPNDAPGIDATLQLAGAISLTVSASDGGRVGYLCVTAYDAHGEFLAGSYSDETGTYLVTGLPPGHAKLEIADCEDGALKSEWYNDKSSFGAADPISVVGGVATEVAAVLQRLPRPDLAIEDLRIENVPLRTDQGPLVHTGMQRKVHVRLSNRGNAATDYAEVVVRTRSRTDGTTRFVGGKFVSLKPGEERTVSVTWDATGTVGDVTVSAQACVYPDSDQSNNYAEVDHYAGVGGSGVGLTIGRGDYGGCYGFIDK